jgi:hypothetical protein
MTKCTLSILSVFLLLVSTTASSFAQTPLEYFQLGQFLRSMSNTTSVTQYGKSSDIKAKLNEERRLLVKLGAPTAVLTTYDHMVNSFRDLPWGTSYSSWTQDQLNAYTNSGLDWTAVNAWLGSGDTQPHFYFWLGYDTYFLAYMGPQQLNAWGFALADVQTNYKIPLADFVSFSTSYPISLKTALPDVQAAITAIAAYGSKVPSKDDMTALQTQANIIYNDANGRIAQ